MNPKLNSLILFVPCAILAGCAAVGVLETNDPDIKIRDAYELFDHEQRPLPAERLIQQAIAIYQSNNDDLGLGGAYRAYGFFFRSASITKWHKIYEASAFIEAGATYVNRYDKSIEYFEKSAAIFEKHQNFSALTNIYLNMGFTYEFASQPEKACEQYKKSLICSQRQIKNHPDASVTLPQGFSSYETYITSILERLKCAK